MAKELKSEVKKVEVKAVAKIEKSESDAGNFFDSAEYSKAQSK